MEETVINYICCTRPE